MSLEIEIVPLNDTLAELQQRLRDKETIGFELITLARGIVGGQIAMLATYLRHGFGAVPPPLTLLPVAGDRAREEQQASVTAAETGNKRLISYAAVFVGGQETNVAVYRG